MLARKEKDMNEQKNITSARTSRARSALRVECIGQVNGALAAGDLERAAELCREYGLSERLLEPQPPASWVGNLIRKVR